MAAQPTSRLYGLTQMMSRFLVVSVEPSSWDGRKYRRGWIGQARTMQMAFAAGRSSAGWLMQISLTWCRRRSSKPVSGDGLRGRSRSYG